MDEQALKTRLPDSVAARIQSIKLTGGTVTMVLDASGIAAEKRAELEAAVKQIIGEADGVEEVRVAMVADRVPNSASQQSPDKVPPAPESAPARRSATRSVFNGPRIIAVGSGKGGVGKSTLTANLAVALARMGRKVGVVDADIYGPSQPTLLGNEADKPESRDGKLVPVPSRHGISLLSMGHLVEAGKALAWRGPMAGNALAQLIDAHWGDAELLLIDLPPGTGDVQITMLQKFKPEGAVIVSTPQDLALIDARRAAHLFDAGKVPIIGLVENMSGYSCPHCGEVSNPFGAGGVQNASEVAETAFLGRIPLAMEIRSASDAGSPPAAGDGVGAEAFQEIARKLSAWLDSHGAASASGGGNDGAQMAAQMVGGD